MADDGTPGNSDIPRGLINRTGNPIGKGSRLPSVRGNRDLTLGGVQRKVFIPNLAAVKKSLNKDDVRPSVSSPSTQVKEKQENSRGRGRNDRGRGRGQASDRTIQLHSEFAYGPMGGSSKSSGWGRGGGVGGGGGGGGRSSDIDSTAMKAAMRQCRGTEEDKELSDYLMKDSFISDLSSGDPCMAPIRLPLDSNFPGMEQKVKTDIKEEFLGIDDRDSKVDIKPVTALLDRTINQEPKTVADVLQQAVKSEKGELIFIQFPDTLPGLPPSTQDDRANSTNASGSVSSKEDELVKRLDACQLKDCNEGYMGKLRIRRSGKAELVLGDNIMEVMPGIPINFHQDLVSIRTDHVPGQMVVLGSVAHKLVVTPDYSQLLSNVDEFL